MVAQLQSNTEALSKTHSADKSEIIKTTFRRLLEEQLRLCEEAQKRKDTQWAQLNEFQSANSSLSVEIESVTASAKGQDLAIARTQENISKAQAYFEKNLKAHKAT